jgi:hypothetical protein
MPRAFGFIAYGDGLLFDMRHKTCLTCAAFFMVGFRVAFETL